MTKTKRSPKKPASTTQISQLPKYPGNRPTQQSPSTVRQTITHGDSVSPVIESSNIRKKNKFTSLRIPRLSLRTDSNSTPRPGKLPSVWWLSKQALAVLRSNPGLFLGITGVYTILTILLVRGLAGGTNIHDLSSLKTGGLSTVFTGIGGFLLLLTSSGNNSSPTAGVYQMFLTLFASLAFIWAYRQQLAGNYNIRVRDAFYRGMYPLIPVLLVVLVIGIQLLPMLIGAGLYSLVVSQGIAAVVFERILWGLVFFGLALASFYMVSASVFGLYIATLPDTAPLSALKSARSLVKHRRWSIARKLLFLPITLLTVAGILVTPVILYATVLAPWFFFLMTMASLPIVHSYMYTVYRELLK